jgi:hypothetical protein
METETSIDLEYHPREESYWCKFSVVDGIADEEDVK